MCVDADLEEGETIVVNSVKIVDTERLVAMVVVTTGDVRRTMSLCNITWSQTSGKVVVYPEELEICLTPKASPGILDVIE